MKALVAYRLLAPGSEWRLHRERFQRSALAPSSATPSTWCAVDACDGRRMGKVGPTSARSRTSRHPLCG